MPQIGPNLWKVALSFFWWRQYDDGRVEQEFDPLTGAIRPWGETPANLKRAGWLPVTAELARKMAAYGEYGTPTIAPSIIIDLKPGEELEIFKDCQVLMGHRIKCKACGAVFHSLGKPTSCPECEAEACAIDGREINPFLSVPDKWEEVVYNLGVKGLFCHKFNSSELVTVH